MRIESCEIHLHIPKQPWMHIHANHETPLYNTKPGLSMGPLLPAVTCSLYLDGWEGDGWEMRTHYQWTSNVNVNRARECISLFLRDPREFSDTVAVIINQMAGIPY